MTQNNPDPSPSPTRRKLLTGLVAASAVGAIAPQQWTQPVLKRMITPAHGQAVSIAAGRYTARFEVFDFFEDESGCDLNYDAQFSWPGGVDETVVEVNFQLVSQTAACVGDPQPVAAFGADIPIFVAARNSILEGSVELLNTDPPLPAGFSFYLDISDL